MIRRADDGESKATQYIRAGTTIKRLQRTHTHTHTHTSQLCADKAASARQGKNKVQNSGFLGGGHAQTRTSTRRFKNANSGKKQHLTGVTMVVTAKTRTQKHSTYTKTMATF